MFQCALDPDSGARLLEIPQWMFDASAVCLIRLLASAVASCEALRALKELIDGGATSAGKVLQAQHQSLSHTGGSDAKRSEVTPSSPVAVVSATDSGTALGGSSTRGSTSGTGAARAMVASAGHRRRHRSGGAR